MGLKLSIRGASGPKRILLNAVDLEREPLTREEEQFVNLVFVHFATGWTLASKGSFVSLEAMKRDGETSSIPLLAYATSFGRRPVQFPYLCAAFKRPIYSSETSESVALFGGAS